MFENSIKDISDINLEMVGPLKQSTVFILAPNTRYYCHDYTYTTNVDICHIADLFGNEEQRVQNKI